MTRRSRRLALIAAALAVIGCAVGLGLYAMKDSLSLFLTPSEIAEKNVQPGTRLRIGGLVETGSVVRSDDRLRFNVTDGTKSVGVDCLGDCFANVPDLFREGQGVVVEGVLAHAGPAERRPDSRQARRALHAPRSRGGAEEAGTLAGRGGGEVIVELGHFALVLALCAALAQTVVPSWGARVGDPELMAVGRSAALTQFALVAIAFAALVNAHLTSDFSVLNVAENSHSARADDLQDLRRLGEPRRLDAAVGR